MTTKTDLINALVEAMKEITIDSNDAPAKKDIKIVAADRGWVFVGEFTQQEKSVLIENAYVIRKWGATEGLGELARKGVLTETILDKCLSVEIPNDAVKVIFICDQEKWRNIR